MPALFALADALRLPADPAATTRARLARCLPRLPILAVYAWIRLRLFGEQAFVFGSPTGLPLALAYALETIVAPFVG